MSAVIHRAPEVRSPAVQMASATVAYLAVAWVVWAAGEGDPGAVRVWAPIGLALGFVAVWGARVVPGVAAAAGLAGWWAGAPWLEVAGHVAAVVVAAWGGGALWRSILQAPGQVATSDRVLWLAPVAAGAAAVSSLLVHVNELLFGAASAEAVGRSMVAAWAGHAVWIMAAAPLMWMWSHGGVRRAPARLWLSLAGLALPVLFAAVVWAPLPVPDSVSLLAFLVVPAVFMVAVWHDPRATTAVGAVVVVAAMLGSMRGLGPFQDGHLLAMAGLAGLAAGSSLLPAFVSTMWTERRDLRDSLVSSERRWRDLVRSAPEVILSVARDGTIQMTNKRGDGPLGAVNPGASLFDIVAPEHQGALRAKLDVVFWNATDTSVEVDVQNAGNKVRTYLLQMGPLREGERVGAAMLIAQDVTERNRVMALLAEREARLRAVYDRSPMPTSLLSAEGKVLEVNLALENMLASGDASLNQYLMEEIVHPEDRADWRERFSAISRGARSRFEAPFRVVRRDGTPVFAKATVNAVRSDDDQIRFAVVQWEDQSAARRADEAEGLANQRASEIGRLEEVSAWKSELLHIASHEIRNPLTPMHLQLDLLDQRVFGPLTEKQERAVHVMRNECERLASLVSGILDAARVETGRLAVRRASIDLAAVVAGACEPFETTAAQNHVALAVDASGDARVVADSDRLLQVVVNLVSNALKFTPQGGRITVTTRREGRDVLVEVTDSGPGMSEEQLGRLFEAFSQVHDVQSGDKKGGIGLGLYIARGIVEAHNGRIWATSKGPGQGSTFAFSVPAAQLGIEEEADGDASVPAHGTEPRAQGASGATGRTSSESSRIDAPSGRVPLPPGTTRPARRP